MQSTVYASLSMGIMRNARCAVVVTLMVDQTGSTALFSVLGWPAWRGRHCRLPIVRKYLNEQLQRASEILQSMQPPARQRRHTELDHPFTTHHASRKSGDLELFSLVWCWY